MKWVKYNLRLQMCFPRLFYVHLPKEISTVRLRRIGQEYRNEHYRIISSIFPLQLTAKSAHARLLRCRHALRENCGHWHVVSLTCCHWISCERGKLVRSRIISDFVMCMKMPAWVPAVSEGGWNILRTETRTSPISLAVMNRELLQLSAKSKKSSSSHKTEG